MATKSPPAPKPARRTTATADPPALRPETDDQLLRKLFDAEGDCWPEHRVAGLTDEDLQRELDVNRFASIPNPYVATQRRAITGYAKATKPSAAVLAVWLDAKDPLAPPSLQGSALVDRMRGLLSIPRIIPDSPDQETKPVIDETPPADDEVPIDRIGPKQNPRKHFDPARLQELADNIQLHGILQPLVVRPAGPDGRYELVAGERRLRAAKLAGLKAVPVRLVRKTDLQTAASRLAENLLREDLNPIEEALGYQDMLDRFPAELNQKKLAAQVGRGESHVSNRLRLLKLPEEWQQKIAAKEMTDHHGWALLPWADRPAVMDEVHDRLKRQHKGRVPLEAEFKDLINRAVDHCSRPLKAEWSFYDGRKYWESFTIKETHPKAAELELFEFKGHRKEKRCWNIPLWEKVVTEQQRARSERDAAAATKAKASSKAKGSAESAKKQADIYAKKLWRYTVAWHQAALLGLLRDEKRPSPQTVTMWLLYQGAQFKQADRDEELASAVGAGKRGDDLLKRIVTMPAAEFADTVYAVAQNWLSHSFEGWQTDLRPDTVMTIAKAAGVDVAKEWILDEDFLQLHTTDQLQQLAKEWKLNVPGGATRKFLVSQILKIGKAVKTPERLIKPKEVRLV